MQITLKPVEALLFRSDVVALGTFRCPAVHPLYRDSGPSTHHAICFPRTSTVIEHEKRSRFVASPNTASLFNQHQTYRRQRLDAIDATDWIVLSDDVLGEVIASFDPAVDDRRGHPFRHVAAPLDARTYLGQRHLFEHHSEMEVLDVEERAIEIVSQVLSAAYGTRPASAKSRDRAEAVKSMIASAPASNVPLRVLARAVESSPFHLCRVFRACSGVSIGAYRDALRLRLSLALLDDRTAGLTDVALELGYSSHSHFTAKFRDHFGITPSQFRRALRLVRQCDVPHTAE